MCWSVIKFQPILANIGELVHICQLVTLLFGSLHKLKICVKRLLHLSCNRRPCWVAQVFGTHARQRWYFSLYFNIWIPFVGNVIGWFQIENWNFMCVLTHRSDRGAVGELIWFRCWPADEGKQISRRWKVIPGGESFPFPVDTSCKPEAQRAPLSRNHTLPSQPVSSPHRNLSKVPLTYRKEPFRRFFSYFAIVPFFISPFEKLSPYNILV